MRSAVTTEKVAPAGDEDGRMGLSEETGRVVLAQLRRRTRALRVPPEDREDLVQDVAIWIALHREPGRPVTEPWLWSVLARFARSVRRWHRRETPLDDLRAGAEPTRAPRRPSPSIEELTRGLGTKERRVVDLLLEGHTWAAALRRLGVPLGSRSRWRSRIRRAIEKAIGRFRTG